MLGISNLFVSTESQVEQQVDEAKNTEVDDTSEGLLDDNSDVIHETEVNAQAIPSSVLMGSIDAPESCQREVKLTELQELYVDLYLSQSLNVDDDVTTNKHLQELHSQVCHWKSVAEKKSETGKLWVMFMNFVSVVRTFIRAERTGNW